jgi:predicted CoA-binding protein
MATKVTLSYFISHLSIALPINPHPHPHHPPLTNPPTIVFKWYTHHSLPVTPINPNQTNITAAPPFSSSPSTLQTYPTLPSVSSLPSPTETSVSIIAPPAVTIRVLREAKAAGVPAVWLQPGTFDDDVLRFARSEFGTAVVGDGGRGDEGWCVLVDGERAARAAGKL